MLACAGLGALILVLVRTVSIVFGHGELWVVLVLLAELAQVAGDVAMVEAGRSAARRVHRMRLLYLAGRMKQIRVGREQLQAGGHTGEVGRSAGIRLLIDV